MTKEKIFELAVQAALSNKLSLPESSSYKDLLISVFRETAEAAESFGITITQE